MLYHACQLRDFESYARIGGIPSRRRLESEGLPFTPFSSDAGDIKNELWGRIFFNLQDFGSAFESTGRKKGWVPNVYGPITTVFPPKILQQCGRVAISLKSAGNDGFRRYRRLIASLDDVERLFAYPRGHPLEARLRTREQLKGEFDIDAPANPEVWCESEEDFLSFKHALRIVVDPYSFRTGPLIQAVRSVEGVPASLKITSRCDDPLYTEIGALLYERPHTPRTIAASSMASDVLKEWARSVANSEWPWQFQRYSSYLRDGTVMRIMERHIAGGPEKHVDAAMEYLTMVRQEHPRAYTAWSSEEEESLRRGFEAGMSVQDLARRLGRQPGAIQSRLTRLALSQSA